MAEKFDRDARFRRLEKRAKQDVTSQKQQAQEGLRRKFAAQGLGSSGAAIKQEQIVEEKAGQALGRRLEGVASLREEEAFKQEQIDQARKFQTSEREAGQKFGARQAALGRAFSTSERLSSQQFASNEAQFGRDFANKQLKKQQAFQKNVVLKMQQNQFNKQMALALKKYKLDEKVTNFNMDQAIEEANKPDFFEKGLGAGKDIWGKIFGSSEKAGTARFLQPSFGDVTSIKNLSPRSPF